MCFVGASTAIKIFIGEGEQEGEVIRQFQPGDWERQFSIKDADYGDRYRQAVAGSFERNRERIDGANLCKRLITSVIAVGALE